MKKFKTVILAALLVSSSGFANADFNQELSAIQKAWASVNYELQDEAQEKAFEALVKDSQSLVANYPDKAESHIWHGIVQSSYAGAKGGLGALGLAKAAKAELEAAIEIDESALSGSALTSLGTLYSQVPGWPIGFGSDKKAQKLFDKALKINPTGLDVNYFYGQFLYDEKQYKEALEHLKKAKNAPARLGREKADLYRQQEVDNLIAKVERKLKHKR
ncbi:tetratricopeptide repeat protein [Pseudoalteromonas sp. S16_S37]|uniref:tetratricopeptide repeat protein n=1 Tax=Pseudoalteromonas sp. S16_S37 TaxID=2720228 RepID=UPI0016811B38|nr:tetratricopeptide repeat protein [Pseudoalteromonas sp. S16_S37]MBD1584338.1 hypothetical protein [Pseudoalteromonas sp. S16_S37]